MNNWAALAELEREDRILAEICCGYGAVVFAAIIFSPISLGFAGVFPLKTALNRLQKINRIRRVMKAMLSEFGDDIVITPRVPVPGEQPIDMIIKFPRQALFLVSIRSKGKKRVFFKEKTKTLSLKSKTRKGLSDWKPDPLIELGNYQRWLKKNRLELGLSSKELKLPFAKVLVLAGETDIHPHEEHLYLTMGNQKFLWVNARGTSALIRIEEIVEFTKCYLAYQAEKRKQLLHS
ncbi:MAG: hypothetical protein SAL07_23685 [Oscillatoria sp. PMC 1051.18]|nr:hypothetical protein [Oscillatoria sp. PMC 1050.18]MEC5032915.1 hypothetical protein [Oscillatoria sp. PMC 1051.18]